jgi:hypothetical protein
MNYLELLPCDLRFYIAEFVPSKPERPLPYIREYHDVLLDWYNKTRVFDDSVYRNYQQLYALGIDSDEVQYIKRGFFNYAKDRLYYHLNIDHNTGQFIKIAKIRNWNVSEVTDMSWMFTNSAFNQPIGNWNVSDVTDISWMFTNSGGNSVSNQPIGN